MDKDQIISALNDLLRTATDSEEGFKAGAGQVKSPAYKAVLQHAAKEYFDRKEVLNSAIVELGGEPAGGGSVSGALHRAWAKIRSSLTDMDDHAILAECERAQDVAKATYKEAIEKPLPPDLYSMVEQQYKGVEEDHDKIRDLRDGVTSPQ